VKDSGGESGSKAIRLWIVALAVVIAVGLWYFRGSRSSTEAQGPGGGPAARRLAKGKVGREREQAASSARGGCQRSARDLPVYFNGLGTVTAFNTVTVRSRRRWPDHQDQLPGRPIRPLRART